MSSRHGRTDNVRGQGLPDTTSTWNTFLSELHSPGEILPSVSTWTDPYKTKVIQKHFKLRQKFVSPDMLCTDYMWGGFENFYKKWLERDTVTSMLQFVKFCTACIDTNEQAFFCNRPKTHLSLEHKLLALNIDDFTSEYQVLDNVREFHNSMDTSKVMGSRYRQVGMRMMSGVRNWLDYVAHILGKDPRTLPELLYEEVFRKFLDVFDLIHVSGSSELFTISYGENNLESRPNVLFGRRKRQLIYWGPAEVKHIAVDPAFQHFFEKPGKENLKSQSHFCADSCLPTHTDANPSEKSEQTDDCSPPKKKCVSSEAQPDKDEYESSLPDNIQTLIDTFFGQLFGSVIALDCHQPSTGCKRLGIGVVGFRVMFLAFYAKPKIRFSQVLNMKESSIEVQVTRPLCILDGKDREEIVKILLQLAVVDPL